MCWLVCNCSALAARSTPKLRNWKFSQKFCRQIQNKLSTNPKKIIDKSKKNCQQIQTNPKIHIFGKSKKPLKFRSFWHQRNSNSSFRCQDIARNPRKSRNPEIKNSYFFGKSKKPSKIRSFWHHRISGSSFRCRDIVRFRWCKKQYGRTNQQTKQF